MMIKDLSEFIFESCYKQLGFTKDTDYYLFKNQRKNYLVIYTAKLTKKTMLDPSKAKERTL